MKALRKSRPEYGIWMEEVPMPEVGVNDVLIKVKKAAICGTDLHMYKWDDWSQKHCVPPFTPTSGIYRLRTLPQLPPRYGACVREQPVGRNLR